MTATSIAWSLTGCFSFASDSAQISVPSDYGIVVTTRPRIGDR
jgi:hypothetical protein